MKGARYLFYLNPTDLKSTNKCEAMEKKNHMYFIINFKRPICANHTFIVHQPANGSVEIWIRIILRQSSGVYRLQHDEWWQMSSNERTTSHKFSFQSKTRMEANVDRPILSQSDELYRRWSSWMHNPSFELIAIGHFVSARRKWSLMIRRMEVWLLNTWEKFHAFFSNVQYKMANLRQRLRKHSSELLWPFKCLADL